MAGNLHLIAANGIDNLAEPIATKDKLLDYLLNEMDTDNIAARLLLGDRRKAPEFIAIQNSDVSGV